MTQFDDSAPQGGDSPEGTEHETPGSTTAEADEAVDEEVEDTAAEIPDTEVEADGEEARAPRGPVPLQGILPEDIARGIKGFDDLPLHPRILESIAKIGWKEPTPVQKLCLPYSLRGRDTAGFAQTGTGKTGVFNITILNRLLQAESADTAQPVEGRQPRAVVLAPTRELAMQSESDAAELFSQTGMVSIAVFGGIDYDKQAKQLKDGVDVIFATPGRLMDYVKKKYVKLDQVQVFVCDEADRMFDMGFIEDVEFFLERIPESAQRMLFSATTNEQVKELAFEYLETPEYISVNPETITPERIEMHAIHCHATQKLKVLMGLLRDHNPECSVIFTNTKLTAEWLHYKLVNNGIESDLITGDLPQKKRIKLIQNIKEGKLKALIATDVASRGLHVSRVTHVYNFDLPDEAANYVHRVGRTARAGARGFAYSLVCDDYGQNLAPINDLLGSTIALRTEWPDDKYLTIEDKAGNPFEGRYREREARYGGGGGGRAGAESGRGGGRGGERSGGGDRGGRGGGGGGGGRFEGRDRDRDRERDKDRDQERDRQQDRGRGGVERQSAQGVEDGDKKRRRRRRGKGGGQGEPQAAQGGQQARQGGGQQGRNDGRRDQGRGRGRGKEPAVVVTTPERTDRPVGFVAMIKRIIRTLFGWGK